ncbi:hypothetical protein [Nocardia sp. R6R-6]|uniref:hypothetical protein n=1 Tax=Nocardia sp. R6R-6 TaxID=3459303 RepID=UPI00403D9B65
MPVFVDRRIIREGHWIAYVTHDSDDGAWQFHTADAELDHAMIVSLENVVNRDPSITQLADLPLGWCAWRASTEEPWQRAVNTRPSAG